MKGQRAHNSRLLSKNFHIPIPKGDERGLLGGTSQTKDRKGFKTHIHWHYFEFPQTTNLWDVVCTDESFVIVLGNCHTHLGCTPPNQLSEVTSLLAESRKQVAVLLHLVVPRGWGLNEIEGERNTSSRRVVRVVTWGSTQQGSTGHGEDGVWRSGIVNNWFENSWEQVTIT